MTSLASADAETGDNDDANDWNDADYIAACDPAGRNEARRTARRQGSRALALPAAPDGDSPQSCACAVGKAGGMSFEKEVEDHLAAMHHDDLRPDVVAEVVRLMEWARQGDPNAKTIDSGARIMVAGHVPLKWVEMTLPPDDWRAQ